MAAPESSDRVMGKGLTHACTPIHTRACTCTHTVVAPLNNKGFQAWLEKKIFKEECYSYRTVLSQVGGHRGRAQHGSDESTEQWQVHSPQNSGECTVMDQCWMHNPQNSNECTVHRAVMCTQSTEEWCAQSMEQWWVHSPRNSDVHIHRTAQPQAYKAHTALAVKEKWSDNAAQRIWWRIVQHLLFSGTVVLLG